MNKKMTLNELMGSVGDKAKVKKLGVDDLPQIFKQRMPKLPKNPIGALRLRTALRNHFGDDFMNVQGISDIVKEFDDEVDFNVRLHQMKMIGRRK